MPQYQTFEDRKGHSDSRAKLAALKLPDRLDGMAVLDIACNEGFFCQEAWRRGAARVVGVDRDATFIARARERDDRTDYRQMDWLRIGEIEGEFDLILLLSSLHYAEDPAELLELALDRLKPDGVLVVECGVADGAEPRWVPVARPRGDTVLHPTRSMVMSACPGAVVRMVGPSVDQAGDPVSRAVFRFTPRRPMAVLIAGPSGSGKSTLLRTLRAGGHQAVGLDHMLATLDDWCTDAELLEIAGAVDPRRLGAVGERIAARGAEERLVDAVLARRPDALHNDLTLIEGHLLECGEVAAVFARRLADAGVYVWHASPSEARPRPRRG